MARHLELHESLPILGPADAVFFQLEDRVSSLPAEDLGQVLVVEETAGKDHVNQRRLRVVPNREGRCVGGDGHDCDATPPHGALGYHQHVGALTGGDGSHTACCLRADDHHVFLDNPVCDLRDAHAYPLGLQSEKVVGMVSQSPYRLSASSRP